MACSSKNGTMIHEDGVRYGVWSIGGIKTCIYARWGSGSKNAILFDVGNLPTDDNSVYCVDTLCLTHTHKDHIQKILEFLAGRERITGKKDGCTIYVPSKTGKNIRALIESFYECDDSHSPHIIQECEIGSSIGKFGENKNIEIIPFQTYHRVSSNGYRIRQFVKEIREEYLNITPSEKGILGKSGELYLSQWVDTTAITGDTTIEAFTDPSNIFLKDVRTLFTEITFLDKGTSYYEAEVKGHIHLFQLKYITLNNKTIIGYHFSSKYTQEDIDKYCSQWYNETGFEGDFIMANTLHSKSSI